VFALLGRGDTMGVFQLESPPMRALLRSLAPTSFDDVSQVLALYRPGPMSVNMHYDYADRKNNRKPVEYFHEDAKEILGDTYGLMIYQESVMRVAQKFAGYSLAPGRPAAQGDGQEVARGDGEGAGGVRGRLRGDGYGRKLGDAAVRGHREVRRLRVQQEPHVRLRPRHVPDRRT
jgi:DNA polymerase-3 subunit alpha